MKINFTLQDVAQAMIDNGDHSNINNSHTKCRYFISVDSDGSLGDGEDIWTDASISSDIWNGIDEEADDAIERFLDKFDDFYETLDNPDFHEAAEDLMEQAKAL